MIIILAVFKGIFLLKDENNCMELWKLNMSILFKVFEFLFEFEKRSLATDIDIERKKPQLIFGWALFFAFLCRELRFYRKPYFVHG